MLCLHIKLTNDGKRFGGFWKYQYLEIKILRLENQKS